MIDLERIKFSLIVSLLPLVTITATFLITYLWSRKDGHKNILKHLKATFDWKEFLLFMAFSSLLYYMFFPLLQKSKGEEMLTIVACILMIVTSASYEAILYPIVLLIRTRKYERRPELEAWLCKKMNERVKVRVINNINLLKASAVEVLPFSRIILIGQPLLDALTDEEVKCILLHEMGHTRKKHILYLFILIFFVQVILMVAYTRWIFPWLEAGGYHVVVTGAALYLLFVLAKDIFGLYQKRMEFSADSFAAKLAGKTAYADVLIKLDKITGGMLSRKTLTHPTLNQRLNNIAK